MYNLLKNRRSIRKYTDEKVEKGIVDLLIKSVLKSPSGKSINPWEIIYVDSKSVLKQLSSAKENGAKFLENANQCLIILTDEDRTDIWIEDGAIAATIAHLSAESLGLGSCWIQIRNRKNVDGRDAETVVQELLDIPTNMRVEAIISFGYANEDKKPHSEDQIQYEKVHINAYNSKYFNKKSGQNN